MEKGKELCSRIHIPHDYQACMSDYSQSVSAGIKDPLAHIHQELEAVISFSDRANAIDGVGDLIVTVIGYVNSLLPANEVISLTEVLELNYSKLENDKS